MEDRTVLEELSAAAREGRSTVLATVVQVKGSTPRDVGSKMIIDASGDQVGTIGGGCGEAEVLEAARAVMKTGDPQLVRVELTDEIESFSPAVCGGVMEIFVELAGAG